MKARVVNVILVEVNDDRTYYTLEGLEIGKFVAGKKTVPVTATPEIEKPKSAITTAPTPKEVKRDQGKYNDEMMKVENRIPLNE